MRKFVLAVALLAWLGTRGSALAVIGIVDDVPAATLLLPYFAVDPSGTGTSGVTTLLTITDASATAILAHVTVWSDLAVPVMAFNMYFTGYDQQTMDLQDVFAGRLPQTASAGQDPTNSITPHGPLSQDINFASCTGQLPIAQLSADFVAHVNASLSGKPSPTFLSGKCAGRDHGDSVLRGFITVDTVNNCTLRLPGDPGYFTSDVTDQNVLWGSYRALDKSTKRVRSSDLVAVEASPTDPLTTTAGNYTFYGRLVNWLATDHREPLATSFAAQYVNTGAKAFPSTTDLIVWRDPKVAQEAFTCGSPPVWYPLGQEGLVAFDEQENVQMQPSSPVAPQPPGNTLIPFPAAAQRVRLNGSSLPISFTAGWLYLDLNSTIAAAGANPPVDPTAAQAWTEIVEQDADAGAYGTTGRTATQFHAVQLDNASGAGHFVP